MAGLCEKLWIKGPSSREYQRSFGHLFVSLRGEQEHRFDIRVGANFLPVRGGKDRAGDPVGDCLGQPWGDVCDRRHSEQAVQRS